MKQLEAVSKKASQDKLTSNGRKYGILVNDTFSSSGKDLSQLTDAFISEMSMRRPSTEVTEGDKESSDSEDEVL